MNDGVAIVMVFKRSISLIIVLMLEMFFKLKNDKLWQADMNTEMNNN